MSLLFVKGGGGMGGSKGNDEWQNLRLLFDNPLWVYTLCDAPVVVSEDEMLLGPVN